MNLDLIFDIGSNNGDDIPYYLMKAKRVVAFEANPILAKGIVTRFSDHIQSGALRVENRLLVADKDKTASEACFYVHKHNHVLSQFPKPSNQLLNEFETVSVGNISVKEALRHYGRPEYAKIDVENYDYWILSDLFRLQCFPSFLSVEIHSKKVVSLMLNCRKYSAYKLVNGSDVGTKYENSSISDRFGEHHDYSFPTHSAGPFGDDIDGDWLDQKSILSAIISSRLGWKDLHASAADEGIRLVKRTGFVDHLAYHSAWLRPYAPKLLKSSLKTLLRKDRQRS